MNVPLLSCEKRRRREKKGEEEGVERERKKRKTGEGKKQRERLKGDEHRVVAVRLLLSQRSDNYGSRAAPRKRHALSFVEPHLWEGRVCVRVTKRKKNINVRNEERKSRRKIERSRGDKERGWKRGKERGDRERESWSARRQYRANSASNATYAGLSTFKMHYVGARTEDRVARMNFQTSG